MENRRRKVLKQAGGMGAVAAATAVGLVKPGELLAAEWPKAAFEAKTLNDAMKSIGVADASETAEIQIKAPDIAENGAVVPVEAACNIPGVTSIAVFAEKNPTPLVGSFNLMNGAEGYVSFRIKMGQTSNVKVVAQAGGKSFVATKEVKVTIGGCGG